MWEDQYHSGAVLLDLIFIHNRHSFSLLLPMYAEPSCCGVLWPSCEIIKDWLIQDGKRLGSQEFQVTSVICEPAKIKMPVFQISQVDCASVFFHFNMQCSHILVHMVTFVRHSSLRESDRYRQTSKGFIWMCIDEQLTRWMAEQPVQSLGRWFTFLDQWPTGWLEFPTSTSGNSWISDLVLAETS